MSVELRYTTCGETCRCGTPHAPDREPPPCFHVLQCDFGEVGDTPVIVWNHETDSRTVEHVAPVILVSKGLADHPETCPVTQWSEISTFYTEGGRRFMRITADNGSWIWELFDAHWDDGEFCNVYVGRFPD